MDGQARITVEDPWAHRACTCGGGKLLIVNKPQVRLCNSITVMASEWFVEKKEGRSKGAFSAREGGAWVLEVSIGD
jgi:hypothetical protein